MEFLFCEENGRCNDQWQRIVPMLDSETTHSIFKDKKYFSYLITKETHVSTISNSTKLIKGSRRAIAILLGGTKFCIDDVLFSSKSQKNLLSFKDIHQNGYHIETKNKGNKKKLVHHRC